MLFNSFVYPLFLALTVSIHWLLPARLRIQWLIVTGLLFYACHNLQYLLLIGGLALMSWYAGQALLKKPSRSPWVPLLIIVGVLAVFKYSGLLIDTVSWFWPDNTWLAPKIVMPLGISFFTFEFIHYLVDIKRGKITRHSGWEFWSFICFYPTLLAGPIKRFSHFREQLNPMQWNRGYLYWGTVLIIFGYSQKYFLADPLIPFTRSLAHPEALTTNLSALGGLVLYSLRIYFDFAGLSNIAIGSAMLFGIIVPKNFANPYLKSNLQNFWRSWHMSLSSWVRDYIYISLGGNRVSKWRASVNLIVAMLVVGMWHGPTWNFAVWGLYHGFGLTVYHTWQRCGGSFGTGWLGYLLGTACTFCFVTIGWAFFVTTSLTDSLHLLRIIFSF